MTKFKLETNHLYQMWRRLSPLPGGKKLISKIVGRMAPYTGTIDAQILELRPGYAKLEMQDRRQIRNHLESIHAIALMNFAEETSGLAMLAGLPEGARGIIKGLSIAYIKKARGRLVSECRCQPPTTDVRQEAEVQVEIKDAAGDVVARAKAHWLIGPRS